MNMTEMKSEKFGEELYFLMMSSGLKDRVTALGAKYGLGGKALREEVMSVGRQIVERNDPFLEEDEICPFRCAG